MRRLLTYSMVLLAMAMVLAACGGGEEDALLATGSDDTSTNIPTEFGAGDDPAAVEEDSTVEGITDDPTGLEANKIQGDVDGPLEVFTPLAEEGTPEEEESFNEGEEDLGPGECTFFGCGDPSDLTGDPTAGAVQHDQARITVDGASYTVVEGSRIPDDSEYFTVSSISNGSVVLTLTTGQFATGADGITLSKGETIELQNQSEDLSYTIRLVSTSASQGSTTSFDGSFLTGF